ncbi:MAG: putative small protein, partial [Eubacterium sp.]|nr:putative small protein [Eubacterium sp.]
TECEGGAKVSIAQDNQSKVPISKDDIDKLYEMAKTLKYGSITLVFQDGKLIQIEKNEKVRVK